MWPNEDQSRVYLRKQLLLLQENARLSSFRVLEKNPNNLADRGCVVSALAQIAVNGQSIEIYIGLDRNFPRSLPLIYLATWDILGRIPHVQTDGYICYLPEESLVTDSAEPQRILEEALDKAIAVLKSGAAGQNWGDFIDEFDAYWRTREGALPIASYITPGDEVIKIVVDRGGREASFAIQHVSSDDAAVIDYWHTASGPNHTTGLYVPLESVHPLDFLADDPLSASAIRKAVLLNLTPRNKALLRKDTRKYKEEEVVVFRLRRSSEGDVLFGLLFKGVHGAHPLADGGQADQVIPLSLQRREKTYLLPRGGANSLLANARVAIVGCGAVGGDLAGELIQAGMLRLTLLDKERIGVENIFRHVLGKDHVEHNKADALKAELDRRFPYVDVRAIALPLEEALEKSLLDPAQFDLIIMATGDEKLSLAMNQHLYSLKTSPAVLHTWLEPYGIGGHVLVTLNKSRAGCFECLFTPLAGDPDPSLANRASFVQPGQSFSKDVSGCGSRYMPFGALDAHATAILAARTAAKVLRGTFQGNLLFSWKGDEPELIAAGFKVSERFLHGCHSDLEHGQPFASPGCRICGGSHARAK